MILAKRLLPLLLLMLLHAGLAIAQPGGGGGDPGHGQPVPIGGLEILIAAGGLLGLKKYWKTGGKSSGVK